MKAVDGSGPSICGVVLAAGKSTRMGFNKLAAPLANHAMVWYAVQHLRLAGADKVVGVAGYQKERVVEHLRDCDVVVTQDEQLGTGHAVRCALGEVGTFDLTAILFGDCPFITDDIIRSAVNVHLANQNDVTVATARLVDPRALGRIQRDQAERITRVEPPATRDGQSAGSAEVFAGLSIWRTSELRTLSTELKPHQREERVEYDLPDAIALAAERGMVVGSLAISGDDALAPNQPEELEKAESHLRLKIKTRHMSDQVSIYDSSTVRVDYDVSIGRGTVIRANTTLLGTTTVGEGCEIGPDVTLEDCHVADGVHLKRGFWQDASFPKGSRASGARMVRNQHFKRAQWEIPEELGLAFVVMPFNDMMFAMLDNVIRPVAGNAGYACITAKDRRGPGDIVEDIWVDINRASLVIADISEAIFPSSANHEPNANVWYELGLAHALNKDVILLRSTEIPLRKLPFDVQDWRTIFYSPSLHDLGVELSAALAELKLR